MAFEWLSGKVWRGALLTGVITGVLAACGGGGGGDAVTLSTISITPANGSVVKGQTLQLAATANYSDNTSAALTSGVTWGSSNEGLATIDASGLVEGKGVGTVTITATSAGVTGQTTVQVTAPPLVSIAVTPSDPFVSKDFSAQLTATGTYDDGSTADITDSVTWSSSDSGHVSVSGAGSATFVAAGAAGPVTVTASVGPIEGTVAVPSRKVVFVTSATGTADLGSWDDAGTATGLAAGDAICQARADAAGLSGTFVAWLSDATDDAYCRVQGKSGKRSANCGEATLPNAAGPWVRTDGYPFAGDVSVLAGSTGPYTPVRFDETGLALADTQAYFTGTDDTGEVRDGYTCSNWSSSSGTVQMGRSTSTISAWTSGVSACDAAFRLMCVQVGSGSTLPAFPHGSAKKAFITSVRGNGNLGGWAAATGTGIAAGDAICRQLASGRGLANADRFKAWLSDDSTDAIDRITSNGPWARLDGVLVARDKAALVGGNLFSSLPQDETGAYFYYRPAWTGTGLDGLATADNCVNWTSAAGAPVGGTWGDGTDGRFLSDGLSMAYCSGERSLYCLED